MNNPAALTSSVASASLVRQLLADTVQLLPVGKVGAVIHEALSDVYADQMRVVRKTFAAPRATADAAYAGAAAEADTVVVGHPLTSCAAIPDIWGVPRGSAASRSPRCSIATGGGCEARCAHQSAVFLDRLPRTVDGKSAHAGAGRWEPSAGWRSRSGPRGGDEHLRDPYSPRYANADK